MIEDQDGCDRSTPSILQSDGISCIFYHIKSGMVRPFDGIHTYLGVVNGCASDENANKCLIPYSERALKCNASPA